MSERRRNNRRFKANPSSLDEFYSDRSITRSMAERIKQRGLHGWKEDIDSSDESQDDRIVENEETITERPQIRKGRSVRKKNKGRRKVASEGAERRENNRQGIVQQQAPVNRSIQQPTFNQTNNNPY